MIEFESYMKTHDDSVSKIITEIENVSVNFPVVQSQTKKIARAKRIYNGRVISIQETQFTADVFDETGVYRTKIKKKILNAEQLQVLASGIEFDWIVRHDYRSNRNATRVEIQFKKGYQTNEVTLRRLMDESVEKYGHMFRNED